MTTSLSVVHSIYAAFARGDMPAFLSALAPDVSWTEAEGFPYGGTYTGPNSVLEGVFMRLGSEWDGFAAVPQRFVADGDTVIVLGEYGGTYRTTGKRFVAPFVHVWELAGGKVACFRQHTDTAVVRAAMH
jgi:ketosteroid isomerase-like protein